MFEGASVGNICVGVERGLRNQPSQKDLKCIQKW